MDMSDITAGPSIARAGSPPDSSACNRSSRPPVPHGGRAQCAGTAARALEFSDGSCGGVNTSVMQARYDIDTASLPNPATPIRTFAGSTESRGVFFGLIVALAGGGYLALARGGGIGGIGPADLTLLCFRVAAILLLTVLATQFVTLPASDGDAVSCSRPSLVRHSPCCRPAVLSLRRARSTYLPLLHKVARGLFRWRSRGAAMRWVYRLAATAFLCLVPQLGFSADSGLITKESKHSVSETVQRFESAVNAKSANGWMVFTEIDHAAAAEKYGLKLLPRTVVVFGNPKLGTPGMQKAPTVAIDVPLKALVWEDDQGKVWLTYNSAEYLQNYVYPRHGLPSNPDAAKAIGGVLAVFAQQAAE